MPTENKHENELTRKHTHTEREKRNCLFAVRPVFVCGILGRGGATTVLEGESDHTCGGLDSALTRGQQT